MPYTLYEQLFPGLLFYNSPKMIRQQYRFRRWAKGGVFEKIFGALSADADFEYVIVDGTIVRVHQHGTGAKEAMGRATRSEAPSLR